MSKTSSASSAKVLPRKGMPSPKLKKQEFIDRYLMQFVDPAFRPLQHELRQISEIAWKTYADSRKAPVTRKAGKKFANPDYELSTDWLAAHGEILKAQSRQDDNKSPRRILIINASSRSEHTCPGEMSKSYRLAQIARKAIESSSSIKVNVLDLSRLASEYGRKIHPCKACFSTAAPLCHWPCSCYPNHSLGQTQDWMNEIYPMWVEAHGVLIVTPVNWYSVSSPLKLMMDRLVCADGGNPDPTLTSGKDADKAKAIELKGWDYPRHLEGRFFAVVVRGDVEGAENVRRLVSDWLRLMRMAPAGPRAELDRYIGYWKPYATSHDELDRDLAVQEEVRNAARTLAEAVKSQRAEEVTGALLEDPRHK